MRKNIISNNELARMIKRGFDAIDDKFGIVDRRFEGLEKRVGKIEATMVTKSYLDDKLADLEGSLIVRQRKEDSKVNKLVEILRRKDVLDDGDTKILDEIRVFPKLSLDSTQ